MESSTVEQEIDYKKGFEERGETLKNMEAEIYRLIDKIASLQKIIQVLKNG